MYSYALLQLLLFLISITQTSTMSVTISASAVATTLSPPPRIAVIGAGAAGLACARVFSRAGWVPTVFEKSASVGGVWNYQAGDKERPMYQGLRTNLPKEVMAFRECPWMTIAPSSPDLDSVSYVTHRQVQEYLQAYTNKFNLQIQYKRPVKHLQVVLSTTSGDDASSTKKSRLSPPTEDWPMIELLEESATATNSNDSSGNNLPSSSVVVERHVFDAVIIANGHYGVPSIPYIPGVVDHFKQDPRRRIMHSVEYDNPQEFENQTVLCIGGRASGTDIARELASGGAAKKVYLSDSDRSDGTVQTLGKVCWVPRTVAILESGAVQFDHNCTLQPNDIDVIIYCTGYDYVFPFIDAKSNIELDAGNRRVKPLYEQLWHAQYPNIVFVGLPHSIVPFPVFELQAEATLQTWKTAISSSSSSSNGNGKDTAAADILPNLTERLEAAKTAAESGGEGKLNGHVPRDTHYLGNAQWDYCRRMARIAGLYDETMEEYIATNKKLYDQSGANRKGEFPGGPDHYRDKTFSR